MIEINLLPEEMRKKEPVKLALPEMPIKKTMVTCLSVVFGVQALMVGFALALHLRVGWLEKSIADLQGSGSEIASQKAQTLTITERLKQLRAATSRKFYWAQLLEALTASTTRGVWLRHMDIRTEDMLSGGSSQQVPSDKKEDDKKSKSAPASVLVLEGSAIGAGQETAFIGKYLQSLKDNPFFSDVFSDIKLADIQQRRIEQVDAYDFMIVCKFKKEKS